MGLNIKEMDVEQLKDYINNALEEEHISVNTLCKQLKISKVSIITKLKEGGYSYSREQHKYIKLNKVDIDLGEKVSGHIEIENKNINEELKNIKDRLDKLEKINKKDAIVIKNSKDTVVKSVRLYKEVKEQLDKYIKKNKKVKVMDIINNAILEYINKHK